MHDAGQPTGSCNWPVAHHQLWTSITAERGTSNSMTTHESAPSVIARSHEYWPANARLSETKERGHKPSRRIDARQSEVVPWKTSMS